MTPTQFRLHNRNRRLRLVRGAALAIITSALTLACLPASALADGVSVSGTVLSAQGSPVANVNVTLVGAVGNYGADLLSVATDANGNFTFAGVTDGTYGIAFNGASCGGQWVKHYLAPTGITTKESEAQAFTVAGAAVTGLSVTCPKTYSISGHVFGPGGKPLASITVEARPGSAQTLADGSFNLAGLEPGSYSLFFEDGTAAYQDGYAGRAGLVHTDFEAMAYTIGSSDLTGISITLPKALSISGHVRDGQGNPLAGMTVMFTDPGGMEIYQNVTTTTDGSFLIPGGTPQQSGFLVVSDPSGTYAPEFLSRTGVTPASSQALPISLAAGSVKNLDIVAQPGRSISGTALAADGTPLQCVFVYPRLWVNGAIVSEPYPITPNGSASGMDGTFSLTNLAPGTYVLQVMGTGPSGYYSKDGVVPQPADATPVDVSAGSASGLTIHMTQLGTFYTLSGSVFGSDGNPVASARLSLSCVVCGYFYGGGSSDGSGSFSIGSVPSGQYDLLIQPTNNQYVGGFWTGSGVTDDASKAAIITVSGDSSVSVTIPVAEHITGRVVMPNGIPVEMAEVYVDSSQGLFGNTIWQPRGAFDVAVPAGSYQLDIDFGGGQGVGYYSATSPGAFTFDQTLASSVAATASGGQGITIVQPDLPQIAGRLLDSAGAPLGSAFVYLYKAGSSELPSLTLTDPSGWFAASAAPGSYQILVGGNGNIIDAGRGGPVGPLEVARSQQGWYARHGSSHFTLDPTKAGIVTIGASGINGLIVRIPDAVAIQGTVTGPNGKGILGIRADALDPTTGAVVGSAFTARNGTYSIAGLNSGSYKVRVVDPAGVFNIGYVGKKGTVDNLARAAALKVGATNRLGVDATLTRAKK